MYVTYIRYQVINNSDNLYPLYWFSSSMYSTIQYIYRQDFTRMLYCASSLSNMNYEAQFIFILSLNIVVNVLIFNNITKY